jgi:Putative beta-barrel porin-2, OmpL-like. bbp2
MMAWLRSLVLAALASFAALQGSPSRAAEDPPCSLPTAFAPPCLLLPAGPSVADHSGNHDHEFFWILFNAYADEWNRLPPDDPNAAPSRRAAEHVAPSPQTSPPYPFTDWPFGGTEVIGGAVPNAIDSPLMKALIGGTPFGKPLEDAHVQIYGWINIGGNVTAAHGFNGNAPVSYTNTPDIIELDQAVVYIERVPYTVQKTNLDWGFRLSPIYGENYRYTTALGFFSNQLAYQNHFEGFDMPMAYAELYVPYIGEGILFRLGRYISLPDIEAQLAPNNYMYSHSITYAVDNYTNTGLNTTLKVTKNWMVQFGVSAGTETFPWNAKFTSIPGYQGPRDPGAQPTFSGCIQYESNNAWDNIYVCANDINKGQWGYNNLQWYGWTWYHNFSDVFHVSFENYYMFQRGVWNKNYTGPGFANNPVNPYFGTAWLGMANPPNEAACGGNSATTPTCTANEYGLLAYWNYRIGTFDNHSLRTEFYNDMKGQRTGFATSYLDIGLGWQHWFGPQVEVRPEVTYYHAFEQPAFSNGTQHNLMYVGSDVIFHF